MSILPYPTSDVGNNWLNLSAPDHSSFHARFTGASCAADEQYEQNYTR
jgi:hypothetical protein